MDIDKAKEVLTDVIDGAGGLYNLGGYISWVKGEDEVTLDGDFTADELEAIAFWMRNTA